MKRREMPRVRPAEAALYGSVAGLCGTLLLTILMRSSPGMKDPKPEEARPRPDIPDDPFNASQVTQWQDRSRSPAAFMGTAHAQSPAMLEQSQTHAAIVTPAGALAEAQGPGPEGAAEQFALKVSSGLFDADISRHGKLAGEVVHYAYGTFWGTVYGIMHLSFRRPPPYLGPLFGLALWGFGPGWLVPRMKLMRPPSQEPPLRTALMILGHVIFGTTVAKLSERMKRRNR